MATKSNSAPAPAPAPKTLTADAGPLRGLAVPKGPGRKAAANPYDDVVRAVRGAKHADGSPSASAVPVTTPEDATEEAVTVAASAVRRRVVRAAALAKFPLRTRIVTIDGTTHVLFWDPTPAPESAPGVI